jgi:hypothetical protein
MMQTSIDPTSCIQPNCDLYNNGGQLTCNVPGTPTGASTCVTNQLPPGPWRNTCINQHLVNGGSSLAALCQSAQGNYVPTTINLDTCRPQNCNLYNNNGQLACGTGA